MKKRILAVLAIVAVFGLAIATYAYNRTSTGVTAAASSCCGDSCPMKGKKDHGKHGEDHAKGGTHDCCGDSCPIKGEHGKSGDHAKMEGHDCCGDACPMKKKEGETGVASESAAACKCDCCKDKAKSETAAV